jgi:hypothetical protein
MLTLGTVRLATYRAAAEPTDRNAEHINAMATVRGHRRERRAAQRVGGAGLLIWVAAWALRFIIKTGEGGRGRTPRPGIVGQQQTIFGLHSPPRNGPLNKNSIGHTGRASLTC